MAEEYSFNPLSLLTGATSVASAMATLGAFGKVTSQLLTSASGTYTPTANMLFFIPIVVGGGGAGGSSQGTASQTAAASGAMSGNFNLGIFTAAQLGGATGSYVCGAAGTPGSAGNNNGGSGGESSISNHAGTKLVRAAGGGGGIGCATSASDQFTGVAGNSTNTAASGILDGLSNGGMGGNGTTTGITSGLAQAGNGGNSIFANGGIANGAGNPGSAGSGYGAGGAGSASVAADKQGGAGVIGCTLVLEVCSS